MTTRMTKAFKTIITDKIAEEIEAFIKHSRYLNREAIKMNPVSKPLPGTDFLYRAMKDGVIGNDLYQQLKRLAEDETLTYTINPR